MTTGELPFLAVFGIAGLALVAWFYFVAIERLDIGIALVIQFATIWFHWLPAVTQLGTDRPWQHLDQMILPTATLAIGAIPYMSQVTRASLIEVLESDYIEMARLKGAPERTVMWRHAMPNALGPVFQVIAINVAYFAAGVIVVEYLFNYPGIGSALGQNAGGNSLDNTLRIRRIVPTEWVLCDIRIHGVHGGFGHGAMYLFAQDGELMATASQSLIVRVRDSAKDR